MNHKRNAQCSLVDIPSTLLEITILFSDILKWRHRNNRNATFSFCFTADASQKFYRFITFRDLILIICVHQHIQQPTYSTLQNGGI